MKYLIISLLALSCTSVNRTSRDYFKEKKEMRHGIVPISKPVVKDKFDYVDFIDQKAAARGKKVYEAHCFTCHGDKGLGDGPMKEASMFEPANLQKAVKSVPFFKLYMKVSKNQGKMPGWTDKISEKDLNDLANYLMQLSL